MTLQINSIILYNHVGDTRTINFRLGEVNIISGKSKVGKSTLIDIIDYCMGTSDFHIPAGVIRDSVAWYAVLFQSDKTQILIAKPSPESPLAESQSQAFIKIGSPIQLPDFHELAPNTNDEAVVEYLSNFLDLSYTHLPEQDETRNPLSANIKHTKYYLFQPQNVVANQDTLLYRQSDPFMPQAIKDTLPYFLGVVGEERLELARRAKQARRQLAQAKRRLQEVEELAEQDSKLGQSLLFEAQNVGLIGSAESPNNLNDLHRLLTETLSWNSAFVPQATDDQLLLLQSDQAKFRRAFQRKLDQIAAAELFARDAQGYSTETEEQVIRLQSIGVFDESQNQNDTCPLCMSKLAHPTPTTHAINARLTELSNDLSKIQRDRPKLQAYINTLTQELDELRSSIEETGLQIDVLIREQKYAGEIRDANTRIAHVVGRISLYLETVLFNDERLELQAEVDEAQRLVDQLQEQLDPELIEEGIRSVLNSIGQDMSAWAKHLNMEHDGFYRIDIKHLTVVVDSAGRMISMNRDMGSGANYLGAHLIALLGLHKYFIQNKRPVPGFIVFDQPTQVYFGDQYTSLEGRPEEMDSLRDADRTAIEQIFEFFFDVADLLFPDLQIILLEHANLDNPRFQRALIEPPWRGTNALVPMHWID